MTVMDLFDQASEGDYFDTAFKIFKGLAEHGDHNAFSNLGIMYECGQGVDVNFGLALYWYKKAWRTNEDCGACSNLANFYWKQGNLRVARYWWQKGITKGIGDDALEYTKSYLVKPSRQNIERSKKLLLLAVSSKYISEDDREEAQAILTIDIFKN